MIDKNLLKKLGDEIGVALAVKMLDQFDTYARLLVEWNEKINLTGIVEPYEIAVKHFIDSLTFLKANEIPKGSTLIDVGTGAGFPSIPLKIVRGDFKVTLLDSLNKRINFLAEVCSEIGIEANLIHGRAEEAGQQKQLREKFDVATARAVAELNTLCEFCLPFVKVGGKLVLLKGYEIESELEQAKNAISILGGELEKVDKFILPDGSKRSIVTINKIKSTQSIYPRQFSKIKKQPL